MLKSSLSTNKYRTGNSSLSFCPMFHACLYMCVLKTCLPLGVQSPWLGQCLVSAEASLKGNDCCQLWCRFVSSRNWNEACQLIAQGSKSSHFTKFIQTFFFFCWRDRAAGVVRTRFLTWWQYFLVSDMPGRFTSTDCLIILIFLSFSFFFFLAWAEAKEV